VKEAGITADVVKVQDMDKIIDRGIMLTPALAIDGEEVAVGRVPSVEEIKRMLKA